MSLVVHYRGRMCCSLLRLDVNSLMVIISVCGIAKYLFPSLSLRCTESAYLEYVWIMSMDTVRHNTRRAH